MRFQLPFVILPGDGNLLVLGQVTLREVLCVHVMAGLRMTVTNLRNVEEASPEEASRGGSAVAGRGEALIGKVKAEEEEDGEMCVGPVLCGRQTV